MGLSAELDRAGSFADERRSFAGCATGEFGENRGGPAAAAASSCASAASKRRSSAGSRPEMRSDASTRSSIAARFLGAVGDDLEGTAQRSVALAQLPFSAERVARGRGASAACGCVLEHTRRWRGGGWARGLLELDALALAGLIALTFELEFALSSTESLLFALAIQLLLASAFLRGRFMTPCLLPLSLQFAFALEGAEAVTLPLELGLAGGLGLAGRLSCRSRSALTLELAEARQFGGDTALALQFRLAGSLSFLFAPRAFDRLVVELLIEAR